MVSQLKTALLAVLLGEEVLSMQKILLKCGAFKANLDPSLNGRASAVPLGDSTGVIRWRNHSQ